MNSRFGRQLVLLLFWLAPLAACALPTARLFSLQTGTPPLTAAPAASRLLLDVQALEKLLAQEPEELILYVPRNGQPDWQLVLARHELRTPDFRLTSPDDPDLDAEKPLHFRGYVAGRTDATVALTLAHSGVMAVVLSPEGSYVLGPAGGLPTGTTDYVLYQERELARRPPGHACGTRDTPDDPPKGDPVDAMADQCRYVTLYLECAYSIYQQLGSSQNRVVTYIEGLYNVVAMLLDREQYSTLVSEIRVWTQPDPYPFRSQDLGRIIDAFENANPLQTRNSISLGHLVAHQPGVGGIARSLGSLCQSPNRRLAFSGLYLRYEQLPTYSWDVLVMTHEIGHNLGSPHTHNCVWAGGAIDGCMPVERNVRSCEQPPRPVPPFQGTIMSYCHLVERVGINLNLGFGPQPGDRIREHLAASSCQPRRDCDCHAPRVPRIVERPSPTEIVVQWIAMPRASGYEVEFRRRGADQFGPTLQTSQPSIRLEGLQANVDYEIRVRTRCNSTAGTPRSLWSRIFRSEGVIGPPAGSCRGLVELTAPEGRFSDGSPATSDYANNLDCQWRIAPGLGQPIELGFTRFATEADFDWVEIFDGPGSGAPRIGRFSGTALPPAVTARSGTAFVRFQTDGSVTGRGWELSYRRQPTGRATAAVSDLRITPNPTSGRVSLQIESAAAGPARFAAYDARGRCVFSEQFDRLPAGSQTLTFDASDWAAGLYTLVLETLTGMQTGRLMRE